MTHGEAVRRRRERLGFAQGDRRPSSDVWRRIERGDALEGFSRKTLAAVAAALDWPWNWYELAPDELDLIGAVTAHNGTNGGNGRPEGSRMDKAERRLARIEEHLGLPPIDADPPRSPTKGRVAQTGGIPGVRGKRRHTADEDLTNH